MAKYSFLDTPIGNNKRFLVTCDGKDFAGFDSMDQAKGYVAMHKSKTKGAKGKGKGDPAYAANREWNIVDRGDKNA